MEYSFRISITWKGEQSKGKAMEKIFRAAFERKEGGEQAGTLRDALGFDAADFEQVAYFEDKKKSPGIPPQTLELLVAQTGYNFARDIIKEQEMFTPLFEMFPGLSFYAIYDWATDDDNIQYTAWSLHENGECKELVFNEFDPSDYRDEDEEDDEDEYAGDGAIERARDARDEWFEKTRKKAASWLGRAGNK